MAMRTSIAASAAMAGSRITSQNAAQNNDGVSPYAASAGGFSIGGEGRRMRNEARQLAAADDRALSNGTGGDSGPPPSSPPSRTASNAQPPAQTPALDGDDGVPAVAPPTSARPEAWWRRWRRRVFVFLSDPTSSRWARAYSLYMNLLIVFSTVTFCLQTVPSLNNSPEDVARWWQIEVFVMVQFSAEFAIRLVCAPPPLRAHLLAPLTIIDAIAIAPFYIELLILAIMGAQETLSVVAAIRIVRLARIFRLVRVGEHNRQVRIVARAFLRYAHALPCAEGRAPYVWVWGGWVCLRCTLILSRFVCACGGYTGVARSRDGIWLLVFLLGLAVTCFSTLIYFCETASCTLIEDVWIYNNGTSLPNEPTPYQVRPARSCVTYTHTYTQRCLTCLAQNGERVHD
jgi:hypothetical protein